MMLSQQLMGAPRGSGSALIRSPRGAAETEVHES
jgi:hypothetical protein